MITQNWDHMCQRQKIRCLELTHVKKVFGRWNDVQWLKQISKFNLETFLKLDILLYYYFCNFVLVSFLFF